MKKRILMLSLIFAVLAVQNSWAAFTSQFTVNGPVAIGVNAFPVPTTEISGVSDPASYGNYSMGLWKTQNGTSSKIGTVSLISKNSASVSIAFQTSPVILYGTVDYYLKGVIQGTTTPTYTPTVLNTATPTPTKTNTPTFTNTGTSTFTTTSTPISHSTMAPDFTTTPIIHWIANPGCTTSTVWTFTCQGTNPWLNTGRAYYVPVSGGVSVMVPNSGVWGWTCDNRP